MSKQCLCGHVSATKISKYTSGFVYLLTTNTVYRYNNLDEIKTLHVKQLRYHKIQEQVWVKWSTCKSLIHLFTIYTLNTKTITQ